MNYAPYEIPSTMFVRVSKTFQATILHFTKIRKRTRTLTRDSLDSDTESDGGLGLGLGLGLGWGGVDSTTSFADHQTHNEYHDE